MAAVAGAASRQPSPAAGGRVVVGIDDSPAGLAALRWAIGFARSRGAVHGSVGAYCTAHAHCPVTAVTPRPGR
jgi:nucleotide-binding universal stress UspA family protein